MTSQPPHGPYGPGPVPPPAGYPQPYPPPYGYAPPRSTNTMAIMALVFAFVFAPVAIPLGHIARRQIRETGEEGDGLALAGMIIGYVMTGMIALFCVGYLLFVVLFAGIFALSGTA